MKKKSTKKLTRKNYKSYEKIISIQERIIKIKENEHQMVFKLFQHYLDKSIEGWDWYARYWSDYNRLIKIIKHFDNNATVDDLKLTLAEDPRGWIATHKVPDWFKRAEEKGAL